MIHLTAQAAASASGAAALGGFVLFIAIFGLIGFGVFKGLRALEQKSRTHQIERTMRQAVRDADDEERIARKILAERGQ